MGKARLINEVYAETCQSLSRHEESWKDFLRTAGFNFRLRFDEQILLYAQRPDATAVLPIEKWNRLYGRYVNKGARGIAVFDSFHGSRQKLRHYFDISDTHPGRRSVKVPIWSMEPEYIQNVMETLENSFGELDDKSDLEWAVRSASGNAVHDNIDAYIQQMKECRSGSLLEELDDDALRVEVEELTATSVAYMVLNRIDGDTESFSAGNEFSVLGDFNTKDTLHVLGFATSDIAERLLNEIASTVRYLQKEKQDRTFADFEIQGYDEKRIERNEAKGGSNGNHIHAAGRLPDTEPETAGTGGTEAGTVRKLEKRVSGETQESAVLQPGGFLHFGQASERDRGGGREPEEKADERWGGTAGSRETDLAGDDLHLAWYDRKTEGSNLPFFHDGDAIKEILLTTPHLKASKDAICTFLEMNEDIEARIEFLQSAFNNDYTELILSDGSRTGYKTYQNVLHLWRGAYQTRSEEGYYEWSVIAEYFDSLRLLGKLYDTMEPLPSIDGQLSFFAAKEQESIFTDVIIEAALKQGSHIEGGKLRIYHQFINESSMKANAHFLKGEYGSGGCSSIKSGLDIAEWHDAKGIVLRHGRGEAAVEFKMTWNEAARRIHKLIKEDKYLSEKERNLSAGTQAVTEEPVPVPLPSEIKNTGPKAKYHMNMDAIRLLKTLEEAARPATREEQEVLSRYSGWGGIADAFDGSKTKWTEEYAELKGLLTEDEYAQARASTLTAFYTPVEIMESMYEALYQAGYRDGNILEPCCGTGAFIGSLPKAMEKSRFYGAEIDSLSGRIAKQLYPQANIQVQPFEKTDYPDSFFDLAVGNVPFGDFTVADRRYDKEGFFIHDYMFAKCLDKVRPGGIVAFVTSKGTMDKESPKARRYLAARAELVGAIRLPDHVFKAAGTEVTTDIVFLKKRDRVTDGREPWTELAENEDGIRVNRYFAEHPEMVLGRMVIEDGRFGKVTRCRAEEEDDFARALMEAAGRITFSYEACDAELTEEDKDDSLPATPDVRNFSYAEVDGKIYFREDSRMYLQELPQTAEERIRGMMKIRDCVRRVILLQQQDAGDAELKTCQQELSLVYDQYTSKYGLLTSRANSSAFSADSSYALVSALEVLNDDGSLKRKADIFTKRTIKASVPIDRADTAVEAFGISIAEKAEVDIPYMMELTGRSESELYHELEGVIFLNPRYSEEGEKKYLPADEYLSGNVREKLRVAEAAEMKYPGQYQGHIKSLRKVQPKDLSASEISVRLGAIWIPDDIIEEFLFQLFHTPAYMRKSISVGYNNITGEWHIDGKFVDKGNLNSYSTYGTKQVSGYKIFEETLNLKDMRVFHYIIEDGKRKAVLDKQETAIVQAKQEAIKQAFTDWIWSDPARRERLTGIYNDRFNSIRPRSYDGSHIRFSGMNPEVRLREHQANAVAHILYGGNTLLAHAVGAGKTYEMAAAAMEGRRLGLCTKSLFIVPNHLTEQWASEFMRLYPAANILVATKKDFEKKRRKRFCARIATGDFDAIIIGHSQFEKIPISTENQIRYLKQQIDEIEAGIKEAEAQRGERYTVKQLELSRKSIEARLDRLNEQERKDNVVTFEELGVDRIYVDEAHYFKNLYLYTKMRNVGGIAQTEAQKSSDLYLKTQYLDELTGRRGTVFATGTPISNSMVEMYTMQRYLQKHALDEQGLNHFDGWASTFGETVTAVELSPEGTGYRAKTRFARFYNLPELMTMFMQVADIQTADMLQLPVPEAEYINVAVKPSQIQRELVESLSERAEKVRKGMVEAHVDNMLNITNDGRKLALDQRLINDALPDDEGSKVNACAEKVFDIWKKTQADRLTQLVFCDLSTPRTDGAFNVYDDLRSKLVSRGIPQKEICFIHEASTEVKKKELFGKVRRGEVRVLIGSTAKMGAGTNVQDRLIASHDLDCPWRPSDLEQRAGRIVRQGNQNAKVQIYRYVTEQTFDAYLYQLVENKQKFISQVMSSKSPVRSAEDVDEAALSYAEIKMLATGNPFIKEKMDLDIQVSKLKLLKQNFMSGRYSLEDKLIRFYPQAQKQLEEEIAGIEEDILTAEKNNGGFSGMTIFNHKWTEKADAGKALLEACRQVNGTAPVPIGNYRGFEMELSFNMIEQEFVLTLRGKISYEASLGKDIHGNLTRIDNLISNLPKRKQDAENRLTELKMQIALAEKEVMKDFPQEQELQEKSERLDELNVILNLDKHENEMIYEVSDEVPASNRTAQER